MTVFDGYLWAAIQVGPMYRSSNNGRTWDPIPAVRLARVNDYAVLHDRLYVGADEGIGRWNERILNWEYPMSGLPAPSLVNCLAVLDGRLYAGLSTLWEGRGGVYAFNPDTEIWSYVGLEGLSILELLSHESILFAGTSKNGIYASTPQRVLPHAKHLTSWGRLKSVALTTY